MAFVSPLPPDQTGIADYSAELLRELLVFYEIDCIHPLGTTSDPWVAANCGLRSVEAFEARSSDYDRVLYSVGNSTFHAHMFGLMVRVPGVVILHDAFLSDIAFHLAGGAAGKPVLKELYRSHGLTGLRRLAKGGPEAVIADLLMSGSVFRNAQGVIVHSRHAVDLAAAAYGEDVEAMTAIVPQLRSVAVGAGRARARETLGIDPDAFVVCSFGILHPRKSNRLLAEAFVHSALARDPRCRLLFVGEDNPPYSAAIRDEVIAPAEPLATVEVTGRVDDETYGLHLQAADVAVQLRTESRGETSRAILDAMAHGVPTVVTAVGASAELPGDAVVKIGLGHDAGDLAAVLERLWRSPDERRSLGDRGRSCIARSHHPASVGARVRDLVEGFATGSARSREAALLRAIGDIAGTPPAGLTDLERLAPRIEALSPTLRPAQILCDVTAIAKTDLRTGIERVVRAVLDALIDHPPAGFRIEPVVAGPGGYHYARAFADTVLGLSAGDDRDEPVRFGRGDHFLALDWVPDRLPEEEAWFGRFRRAGGTVTAVIYDLLPLEHPQYFPEWLRDMEARWFDVLVRTADHLACISAAVADSVARLAGPSLASRPEPLSVGFFHLGHDIEASQPSKGMPEDGPAILAQIESRPTFLMVGTVEPRKGHAQVVAGFERLWAAGLDIGLAIVGKEGWMVDAVADLIKGSPNHGNRLIWLAAASDEFLARLYARSAALIAASFGEGFGLPLIEAAGHGLPVIARDLPVFREVGGSHAFYFEGSAPDDLARAVRRWLALREAGRAPSSDAMARLTWAEATDQLVAIMRGDRTHRRLGLNPDQVAAS